MKTVEITFKVNIEDDVIEELKTVVDHHIDRLIDLDHWPEINSVFGATCKVLKEDKNV